MTENIFQTCSNYLSPTKKCFCLAGCRASTDTSALTHWHARDHVEAAHGISVISYPLSVTVPKHQSSCETVPWCSLHLKVGIGPPSHHWLHSLTMVWMASKVDVTWDALLLLQNSDWEARLRNIDAHASLQTHNWLHVIFVLSLIQLLHCRFEKGHPCWNVPWLLLTLLGFAHQFPRMYLYILL